MKSLVHIFVVLGLLVLCGLPVEACSCSDPSQHEKFRKADVVFLGEIVDSSFLNPIPKDSPFVQSVGFVVKRQWKGPSQKQIRLMLTFDSPGMCGDMLLTVGSEYLMYAYREKEGLVSYSDCGPNILATRAKADLKNLNSFWFRLWARLWRFN
jgi:hypothetical protein